MSNRINIGFSLAIVFLLVLTTNRIDKMHFETVQNTLTSIHKDRISAQDYVYKMNSILYQKKIQLIDSSKVGKEEFLNKQFETLIDVFATTKLTRNESKTFESLRKNFEKLKKTEQKNTPKTAQLNKLEIEFLEALKIDLDNLAIIQMSESKNLISIAQKTLDSNNLISNLEIGFLILIGFVLQFIIFYRVKKTKT